MDGSSMRIILGFPMSARPTASICCSPPESVPANCLRRSFSLGNRSYTCSISSALFSPPLKAPISRFSSTVIWAKMCLPSGTWARRRVIILLGSVFRRSVPSKRISPLSAFLSPEMARRMVVFPAPLAPIRETISPSSTCMEIPLMASTTP